MKSAWLKMSSVAAINNRNNFCYFCLSFFICMLATLNAQAAIKQNTVEGYLAREAKAGKTPNELIKQSSPYLLQHAYNPVHWYAWGEAAFAQAKKQHKPIFLSIGYSTCHWCHVMAHESFENKEISDYLNEHFIAIKVDREERPDIDSVYMSATQLIHGSGGWPMTVFLDNHLRPFHAATYYPPYTVDGHLGLFQVLKIIHQLWQDEPERIHAIALDVTARIKQMAKETGDMSQIDNDIHERLMKNIAAAFDAEWGGFGDAPKFPKPGIFTYLIKDAQKGDEEGKQAKKMMQVTLDAMAAGGIHDQLTGGFHRYSVDAQWRVPHFEKMLYNQALMSLNYTDFYRVSAQKKYKDIALETLQFALEEMHAPAGGFYSALDADSEKSTVAGEHAEGAYYLWTQKELKAVLSPVEFTFAKTYFDIQKEGNIYSDPRNEFGDANILVVAPDYRNKTLNKKNAALLRAIKKTLKPLRLKRPRPHLDDKIITAWNGMMIKAMANAGKVFPDEKQHFMQQAVNTSQFVLQHLRDKKTGKLYRQYRAGKASVEASLNDYAWLIQGLIALYDLTEDRQWLETATELSATQDGLFYDANSHAYFETANADTNILFRSKSIYDGALPSANAVVILNLKQLASRVSDKGLRKKYLTRANTVLQSFAQAINENPAAAAMALSE